MLLFVSVLKKRLLSFQFCETALRKLGISLRTTRNCSRSLVSFIGLSLVITHRQPWARVWARVYYRAVCRRGACSQSVHVHIKPAGWFEYHGNETLACCHPCSQS